MANSVLLVPTRAFFAGALSQVAHDRPYTQCRDRRNLGVAGPQQVQALGGVARDRRLVGSLNESHLYSELVRNPLVKREPVESIMQPAFPFVDVSTPVELLSTMITPQNPAVLVRDFKTDKTFIITRSDVIRVL